MTPTHKTKGSAARPCNICGLTAVLALLAMSSLQAFPPAPHFTIYGDVRDQYGMLLPANGAYIILYEGSKEILRERLTESETEPFNYEVRMRIDMFRPSTVGYSSLAMRSGSSFSIVVDIGGQRFAPIEMKRSPTIGAPAERRRLDLTLGVDSVGDGIPDAWKEAELYHAGIMPGPDGWDLSLIGRNGDFDGDGMTNWQEYMAGTYATDASSYLSLEIREIIGDSAHLQFYGILGKFYVLEVSEDLENWKPAAFSMESPSSGAWVQRESYRASTTGIVDLYTDATTEKAFYRLSVR